MNGTDVVVIGAGLVGSAVAYGLARRGLDVTLLDEGDLAFRASRGNFGLVWVQGKGVGMPSYARWSLGSARLWPELAAALRDETGLDVSLQQAGGFHICVTEREFVERRERLGTLAAQAGCPYPFEMLELDALRDRLPAIGPTVFGGSYSPMDGHVNPLRLLRALHAACAGRGVAHHSGVKVEAIDRRAGTFTVSGGGRSWSAPRVVLAAGLDNRRLGPLVGLDVPVSPNRGQVLITERVQPWLTHPTNYVRQTDEGTVQIGDSMEDAGYDDATRTSILAGIAARAVRCFPALAGARLVRTWAALRIMSPDGFPIYQESPSLPGAFVVTCHSGVTLAARHVLTLAPWIAGEPMPEAASTFSGTRFTHSLAEVAHGH